MTDRDVLSCDSNDMLADEETIRWPQVSGCRHNLAASASGFCAECSVDYFEEKSIANKRSYHQQSLETNSRKTGGSRTGRRGTVGPECGTISWPLWIAGVATFWFFGEMRLRGSASAARRAF
jgi:hypothetical protein